MAAHLAGKGHTLCGAIALPTLDRGTLLRKLNQWGLRKAATYARSKLSPSRGDTQSQVNNSYLQSFLKNGHGIFRSMKEVAGVYKFPLVVCKAQNAPESIARLREWSPDLVVFTGGNILRQPLLDVPRLGVLNVHLGLLPEIRGMSSPEWSLLRNVPLGITIHYMACGIDTGPILQRLELADAVRYESLNDLRNRLVAFGVEKVAEVVSALDRESISATPQPDFKPDFKEDHQYFVMHEWLQARAAECLTSGRLAPTRGAPHG
jgi:folate-dependent phosphoribosylglycinamide formyltransferase PurN